MTEQNTTIYNDAINDACELAACESGGARAMRDLLFSLFNNGKVELNRCMGKLDMSNQRIFIRIFSGSILDANFSWDFFNARMAQLARELNGKGEL